MHLPDETPPASQPLAEVFRLRRTAALLADAEFIRQSREGPERDEEARRFVREAMMLFAVKKISQFKRDPIVEMLSFATLIQTPDDPDAAAIWKHLFPDSNESQT